MLLFDQNISPKITRHVQSVYPGSTHTRFTGLEDAADVRIFEYARSHGLHIVSFDGDFADLSVVWGHPPKILWLRTGNMTTIAVGHLLAKNQHRILSFINDQNTAHGVLEIYASGIEE